MVQPMGFFSRALIFIIFSSAICKFGKKARAWEPAEEKLRLPLESREGAQLNVALAHELQGQGRRDGVWGQLSSC